MFLSVIVPVHNGERTLNRTLDSIVAQNFEDKEVIIVDDGSTDASRSIINSYANTLNPIVIDSTFDFHCAGNTRQSGLNIAKGDWVTFIDQDDEFLPNAFNAVRKIIEDDDLKYYCATIMIQQSESLGWVNKLYPTDHDNPDPWLHGKFYNRTNLIEQFDIAFKKDLYFLEDIYFNKLVVTRLFEHDLLDDINYHYHFVETYKWYFDQPNCTHNKRTEQKYTHNDWGLANYYCEILYPFYEIFLKKAATQDLKERVVKLVLASLFYVYSAKQFFIEKYGKDDQIVELTELNLRKYSDIIWSLGIKDGDLVEYIWNCINNRVNLEFVSNIFEDPMVWLGNLKQDFLNKHGVEFYPMEHPPISMDMVEH